MLEGEYYKCLDMPSLSFSSKQVETTHKYEYNFVFNFNKCSKFFSKLT